MRKTSIHTKEKPENFNSVPEVKASIIGAMVGSERQITWYEIQSIVQGQKRTRVPVKPSGLSWEERLSYAEESECIRRIKAGGPNKNVELQRLITAHRPLLEAIAKAFSENPEIQEELVQEGILQLIKSINKYESGTRFMRYAIKGIAGRMSKYTPTDIHPFEDTQILRKRVHLLRENPQWDRTTRENKLGPTRIESTHINANCTVSLYEQMAAGTAIDRLKPEDLEVDLEPVDVQIETKTQLALLKIGLRNNVTDRQRHVLTKRYGLGSEVGEVTQYSIIGKDLSVSSERAKQLEEQGLDRLRKNTPLNNYVTTSFDKSVDESL